MFQFSTLQSNLSMPSVNITVNGAGASTQLTPIGTTPNWECVNETSNDGDTTYVRNTTASPLIDTYTFDASSITATAYIMSVLISGLCKRVNTGGTRRRVIRIGGTNYFSSSQSLTTSYSNGASNPAFFTNPANSLPWKVSDLSTMEIGIELTGGTDARCTNCLITINYSIVNLPIQSFGILPN